MTDEENEAKAKEYIKKNILSQIDRFRQRVENDDYDAFLYSEKKCGVQMSVGIDHTPDEEATLTLIKFNERSKEINEHLYKEREEKRKEEELAAFKEEQRELEEKTRLAELADQEEPS